MASKPYFILNIIEGAPGVMYERETHEQAVEIGVKMVKEQCDKNEAAIRAELEEDSNFVGMGFRVDILQTQDN